MRYFLTALVLIASHPARADDEYREFKGHEGPVRVVRFTSDTTKIVSCSGFPDGDKTIRIWDIDSGKELHKLTGHTGTIDALCLSKNGKYILSGGSDGTVRMWETATGKEVLTFKGHRKVCVTAVAFAYSEAIAATGDVDGAIIGWSTSNEFQHFNIQGHEDRVSCLLFSPAPNQWLISGSWDGTVKIWDPNSGLLKKMITIPGGKTKVENIAVTPDGKEIVVASSRVSRWNIKTGEEVKRYPGDAVSVAVSKDGTKLLTGGTDGQMILRDLESGKELAKYAAHKGTVFWVEFAPYEKAAASAGGGELVNGKYTKGKDFSFRLWQFEK